MALQDVKMLGLNGGSWRWKLTLAALLIVALSSTCHGLQRNYKWSTTLFSDNNMVLHWNITETDWWIGLSGNVAGWMGVGLSAGGFMYPGDVAVGYFASSTANVNDYHTVAHQMPSIDSTNNVANVIGSRSGALLELEFSRPLNSGDSEDRVNNPYVNQNLIFASSDTLPASPTSFVQHDHNNGKTIRLCLTCTIPGPPTALSNPSSTASSIFVRWQPPTTGDAPLQNYILSFWQIDPTSTSPILSTNQTLSLPASVTSYNATQLAIFTGYGFQVVAVNALGNSSASPAQVFVTAPAPPSPPTSLIPTSATQTSLTLAWTAPPITGLALRNYTLQFATAGTPSPSFALGCSSLASTASCTVNSLTAGQSYLFRVFATNDIGTSLASDELQAKTNAIGATIVSISDFLAPTASNVTSSEVDLVWSAPNFDGNAEIMAYTIQRSNTTNALTPTAFETVFQGRTLEFHDIGLTRRSQFLYRMSVRNGVGNSQFVTQASPVNTPADPPSPPRLTYLEKSKTHILLAWIVPSDNGGSPITNYNVSANGTQIYAGLGFSFDFTGLTAGQTFLISATASNAYGTSQPSNALLESGVCAVDSECSGHGVCRGAQCYCDDGFTGQNCGALSARVLSADIGTNEFPFSFKTLGGDVTVHWILDSESSTITIAMEVKGNGWAAIGLAKDMSDNPDVVAGRVFDDGSVDVEDCQISGRSVNPDTGIGGTNNVLAFAGKKSGGIVTLKWTRAIHTGDPLDKDYIIDPTISQHIIIAYQPDTTDLGTYHGASHRAKLQVKWATGEVIGANSQSKTRIAHGTLMAFGWLFLIFGVAFAKIVRRMSSKGDLWFRVHRANQIFWSLVVTAAFIIAFIMVAQAKSGHFRVAHAIIGLICYGFLVWQVGWALLRPDVVKDAVGRPAKKQPLMRVLWSGMHIWCGRIACILSPFAVVTGMYQMVAPTAVYAVYGVILGLIIVIVVFMEIRHFMKGKKDEPLNDQKMTKSLNK